MEECACLDNVTDVNCLRLLYEDLDAWAYSGVQNGVYTDDLSGNSANWQLIKTDGGFYIKNLET